MSGLSDQRYAPFALHGGLLREAPTRTVLTDALREQVVWEKGAQIFGQDPALWRSDCDRLWMHRWAYGNRESPFGWEFDHITPQALGGTDDIWNLRPRNWLGNASAGGLLSGWLQR